MSALDKDILVLNPGSTSTKLGLFKGENPVCTEVIRHEADTLRGFNRVWDQFHFRMQSVRLWSHARAKTPAAVASIGGLLRPLCGGTYRVNDQMLEDARTNLQGEHVSNLGCAIAAALADEFRCPAFVVDPASVDEFEPLARYSGHPLVQRKSLSHALNIHAATRRAANELHIPIASSRFVVAHLGGGISVAPVRGNRIVDVNDASSDGPFSPERTGGLPLQQFITVCFSGTYSENEVRSMVAGSGGLVAYLGTNSAQEVEERIRAGDATARDVYAAMAYQIAKEIGAMAVAQEGKLDAIILTGGLATSTTLVAQIVERTKFLARVLVYPGEDELKALALGALRVLRGEEQPLEY